MIEREACGLQAQIVLVRPEPGQGMVRLLVAHDRPRRRIRHIISILNGFEPDHCLVGKGIGVNGTIANGINVIKRRSS